MTTYAGRQRQTALAVWGTIGSTGIAAGVLFGGSLTSALGGCCVGGSGSAPERLAR
jgi:hypothetical protein